MTRKEERKRRMRKKRTKTNEDDKNDIEVGGGDQHEKDGDERE